jgi:hypothetical protein
MEAHEQQYSLNETIRQHNQSMINSPAQAIRAFRALSRDIGWLNASLYSLDRLLLKALRGYLRLYKYDLVAQPVRETPLLPPGRGKKIEVRMIDETDIVTHQFPRPSAVIQARFKQGAKCLVAFKEGEFIGYLWLLSGTYIEDEVRATFSPLPAMKAVWDFDVYVAPEYRVGFAFSRLWDEANRFLAEKEIKWSCSRISAFNPGSLSSHARLGARTLGTAMFFCAGRCQVMFATTAPYIHLSFHSASFPAIRLNTGESSNRSFTTQTKLTPE